MERIIIQKQVCIEPRFMDSDIVNHITNELSRKFLKECNQEFGHIIKINRLIKILDNYINMDSNIIFDVKFEATCLFPKPNKIFTGKVCMIYNDGVFIDVMRIMQILIPKNLIVGYTLNKEKMCFVNDNNPEDKISEGKELRVKVTECEYNNQRFKIFGSIV
jgi:DNA-directed RNA polymerase subunit E'/Rpb7